MNERGILTDIEQGFVNSALCKGGFRPSYLSHGVAVNIWYIVHSFVHIPEERTMYLTLIVADKFYFPKTEN